MLLDSLFEEVDPDKPTPRNDEPAFDAANVLRLGRDLIYLVSSTGNELGGTWLKTILGEQFRVHFLKRCLLRQPHRLDPDRFAPRPDSLQSGSCSR